MLLESTSFSISINVTVVWLGISLKNKIKTIEICGQIYPNIYVAIRYFFDKCVAIRYLKLVV